MKIKNYTHIVWDFNGTLLNDVHCGIRSVNAMLSLRGMPILNGEDDYRRAFCFPIIDYYRNIGFDLDKENFISLAHEWIENYNKNFAEAHLYDGAADILEEFQTIGIKQIIISASEKNILLSQCSALGIMKYFDEILGIGDIYAGGKIDIADAWKLSLMPDAKPFLIGDTVHDFETARHIGCGCVLLAQGHMSREALAATGCMVLDGINNLREFL